MLQCFLGYRFCGHKDPTWLELQHFVHFLGDQLKKVQKNPFCHHEEALPGFKSFVTRFMIAMAQVMFMLSNSQLNLWKFRKLLEKYCDLMLFLDEILNILCIMGFTVVL